MEEQAQEMVIELGELGDEFYVELDESELPVPVPALDVPMHDAPDVLDPIAGLSQPEVPIDTKVEIGSLAWWGDRPLPSDERLLAGSGPDSDNEHGHSEVQNKQLTFRYPVLARLLAARGPLFVKVLLLDHVLKGLTEGVVRGAQLDACMYKKSRAVWVSVNDVEVARMRAVRALTKREYVRVLGLRKSSRILLVSVRPYLEWAALGFPEDLCWRGVNLRPLIKYKYRECKEGVRVRGQGVCLNPAHMSRKDINE
jgi:hypothetical protein